jgi:hypothetical protein
MSTTTVRSSHGRRNLINVISLAAVFLFVGAFHAKGDDFNKETVVTFNTPVEIPGQVLPAGTYVFKLLDSESNKNIVQIFNKHETHLFATILAVPDYRLEPTGNSVLHFEERAAGAPPAVRAWFYPGDNYGQHFVYPHLRATELAKQTNQNVLSMPNELAANTKAPAKAASEPSVAAMKKADVKAVSPLGGQMELSQAVASRPIPAPAPTPAPAAEPTQLASAQREPANLPQTGSDLPVLAMLGVIGLGGACLVELCRRRTERA